MGHGTKARTWRGTRKHPTVRLRNHLGLSLRAFAREIDRSPSFVSEVENGHKFYGRATVQIILRYYPRALAQLKIGASQLMEI